MSGGYFTKPRPPVTQYTGYCASLARYVMRFTRNRADAEDIAQDTLLRAWVARDQAPAEPMGWLKAIARNRFYDVHIRPARVRHEVAQEDLEYAPEIPVINPAGEDLCQLRDLAMVYSMLPAHQRESFELHHIDGLAYDEIAKHLHIPIGTVRSRISRARLQLESVL